MPLNKKDNPLALTYDHLEDQNQIEAALNGSSIALENLVKKHQHYIYNIALKMVLNPQDAEDITQEVLIKMVTKLSQFNGQSNFRTWLYRITFNHYLNMRKYSLESMVTSFEDYGKELDQLPNKELTKEEEIIYRELIKEAKLSCMFGMLLCLNREQRLVYILGEIFNVDHSLGSELLAISKANFRKRLQRARADLYQFMQKKCGLINMDNPCRCSRKTNAFIQAGWVDPEKRKFNASYIRNIANVIESKDERLSNLLEGKYQKLFRDTPFQEKKHSQKLMKSLTLDKTLKEVFNLN